MRALTDWRAWMDRKVRTLKESDQARGTHTLESADRWTSQDTERTSKQRALTCLRAQMDRQVRTWNESKQARGTHTLESTDRQTK